MNRRRLGKARSGDVINLYGAQVYDNSTLALLPGVYAAKIDLNSQAGGSGLGSGTVTLAAANPTPEPSTLVLAALGGTGLIVARRRRKSRAA